MKKLTALALSLLLAASLLAGCQTGQKGVKDTVVLLSGMTPENFDPIMGFGCSAAVTHALFDTLVTYGPNGETVPMIAHSWKESDDGLTVDFFLHEGIKFHNGDPLTADDVVYTYETMLVSPMFFFIDEYIVGCEKVDDLTVRIYKTTPFTKLMEVLVGLFPVLPKSCHSADMEAFDKAPVGCGPYTLVSKENDGSVKLEAFEDYYGDAPGFSKAVVKPPLEPANAVIALENGEVDLIPDIPVAQANLVAANSKLTLVQSEKGWSVNFLTFSGEPLTSDKNLRKAIFHGVNRENAIKLGNEGIGRPATDLFSEAIMAEFAGVVDFVGYDEALAKDYLSKSNYGGEELVLTIRSNKAIAQSIQADLSNLGINISIEQLDSNDFYTKMGDGNTQINLYSTGSSLMSIEGQMALFIKSDAYTGVHLALDEVFEDAYAQIISTNDPEVRHQQVIRALESMYDTANIAPLFETTSNYSYGEHVTYDYPISAPTSLFFISKILPR